MLTSKRLLPLKQISVFLKQPQNLYLAVVSTIGISLLLWALVQFSRFTPSISFLLLIIMAATAQIAATSVPVGDKAGITHAVGPTMALAAFGQFGPLGGVLVVGVLNITTWLLKPRDERVWKKTWQQLTFNTGMHSLAIFVAGSLFSVLRVGLQPNPLLAETVPWLVAAIIYDQLNFALVMVMIWLQNGPVVKPTKIWQENVWAMLLNVTILTIGGGILAFALMQFGWIGIAIFSLPIILSAFSFGLYVKNMKAHMDHLEEIVAIRTQDLTERTDMLEEANRQKDIYLAVLSHDMKTALASVSIYADMMFDDPTIVQEVPEMTDDIRQSLQFLTKMLDNILDLEKIESGRPLSLVYTTFDLNEAVVGVIQQLRVQAMKKSIRLDLALTDKPLMIESDREQVARIVFNLVSNAIKFSPRNEIVNVKVWHNAASAVIEVDDNGYGISADELPHIFDRFRRVTQSRDRAAGTGLGLAIVKSLVDAHNGQIEVVSEPGEGSTFIVRLPFLSAISSVVHPT